MIATAFTLVLTPAEMFFLWLSFAASGALPFFLWHLIKRIIDRASARDEMQHWRSRHKFIR